MIALNNKSVTFRQKLVIAVADSVQSALLCRHFRYRGWDVQAADSGAEVRRLACQLSPDLVLMDTQCRDESGWLTCAKLTIQSPAQQVILIADKVTNHEREFARFVHASAIVSRADAIPDVLEETQQEVFLASCF